VDTKRERARPMSPEERRKAIIAATRPLLYLHGQATTTRLIAEAAGIAEGTVFRAFASKEELFDAVMEAEFDPTSFLDEVARIDPELPLRDRLVEFITLLQARFVGIFSLMAAMGVRKPPEAIGNPSLRKRLQTGGLAKLLEEDADLFTIPVDRVTHMVRLLTFAGSHPHISDQQPLTPAEIADVILHGILKDEGS
jgi:AcrR family transcriptional regulator